MQERSNSVATTPPTRESSTATTYDPYAGRRAASNRLVQAVYLVFGLIEVLLLARATWLIFGEGRSASVASVTSHTERSRSA